MKSRCWGAQCPCLVRHGRRPLRLFHALVVSVGFPLFATNVAAAAVAANEDPSASIHSRESRLLGLDFGREWQWSATAVNLDRGPADFAWFAYDRDGRPLKSPAAPPSLEPAECWVAPAGSKMGTGVATLEARSSGSSMVGALVHSPDGGKLEFWKPASPGAHRLVFPRLFPRETKGWSLTLQNGGSAAADLTFVALTSNGRELKRVSVDPLPGHSSRHWNVGAVFDSTVLDELFTIIAVSDQEVFGHQILNAPDSDLAQLPALTFASRQLSFPILASDTGLDVYASVGVFNPNDTPAAVRVEIVDKSGRSLGVIASPSIGSLGTFVVGTANIHGPIPPQARSVRVTTAAPRGVTGYEVVGIVNRPGRTAITAIPNEDDTITGYELIGSADGSTLAATPVSTVATEKQGTVVVSVGETLALRLLQVVSGNAVQMLTPADYAQPASLFIRSPVNVQQQVLATIFTVNSAADTDDFDLNNGVTTLREALREADSTTDLDEIRFNIPGVPSIKPTGDRGTLGAVQPVIIDGTTQEGGVVELDGSLSSDFDPAGRPMSGLEITGAGSTVKGLFVVGFPFDGIVIRPSGGPTGNNIIKGNTILQNGRHGVRVSDSPDNLIGGNTIEDANFITGNGGNGVRIEGSQAENNKVQGNRIGVNRAGNSSPNLDDAVAVDQAPNTVIGDPEPVAPRDTPSGASNVFVGTRRGVNIEGLLTTSTQTQVNGNFFGLDTIDVKLAAGLFVNGSLFSAGGNVMTKVSGVAIQAFTQVNGSINIRENRINIDGLAGIEAIFGPDRNILFEVKQNIVRGADRSIVAEEMGRGTFNYEFFDNQGEAKDSAISLIFRGEGTKNFDNDEWKASAGAAFAYTTRLDSDLTMRLTLASQTMAGSSDGLSSTIEGSGHIFHTVLLGNATGTLSSAHEVVVGVGFNGRMDVGIDGFEARASLEAGLFFLNRSSVTPVLTLNLERTFGDDNDTGVFISGIWKLKNSIVDCAFRRNTTAGIHIMDGAEARIEGCTIADNGIGLLLEGVAPSEVVGNTLTGNGLALVHAGSTGGILFSQNSIFANAGLGIDLGNDGVTPNDPGDSDTGPNNLQNFPVLTSASIDNGSTTILGTFNSTPNETFTLEFFSDVECDPSGFGEGEIFLGSEQVTTDASGNTAFQAVLPITVPADSVMTSTARDSMGNTSEFSQCLSLSPGANIAPVADAGPDQTVSVGADVMLDGGASNDPDAGPGALTFAWEQIGGTPVVLNGADTAMPGFTADTADTYVFRLTVSDGLASDSDEVSVTAEAEEPDPVLAAVRQLIERVEALDLPRGLERALTAKLEAALRQLASGRERAARNKLLAFIELVEAQKGKKLTKRESRQLIRDAREIIHSIGPPRRPKH